MPTEHGGWGLTLEPGLLGLLIAPSIAGICLAVAGVVAFLARTPSKLVLVDAWRRRTLPRTRLAAMVAIGEIALIVALVGVALARSGQPFWWPIVIAAPLVVLELWYDMRSKSRRLIPELAGAVGVAALAAVVTLAGGESRSLAIGVWLVLAARALTSIPFVRSEIKRLRSGQRVGPNVLAISDAAGLCCAVAAAIIDTRLIIAAVAVGAVVVYQRWTARVPVPPPKVIGIRQMKLGFALVAITALGVALF